MRLYYKILRGITKWLITKIIEKVREITGKIPDAASPENQ